MAQRFVCGSVNQLTLSPCWTSHWDMLQGILSWFILMIVQPTNSSQYCNNCISDSICLLVVAYKGTTREYCGNALFLTDSSRTEVLWMSEKPKSVDRAIDVNIQPNQSGRHLGGGSVSEQNNNRGPVVISLINGSRACSAKNHKSPLPFLFEGLTVMLIQASK